MIYLSCEGPADAVAQSLLQPVTDALLSLCETGEDALVYSLYYNDATPEGLLLNGVELSTASPAFKGPTEISDAVLGTALTVFKQITGEDQLFIPEAKRSTDEE